MLRCIVYSLWQMPRTPAEVTPLYSSLVEAPLSAALNSLSPSYSSSSSSSSSFSSSPSPSVFLTGFSSARSFALGWSLVRWSKTFESLRATSRYLTQCASTSATTTAESIRNNSAPSEQVHTYPTPFFVSRVLFNDISSFRVSYSAPATSGFVVYVFFHDDIMKSKISRRGRLQNVDYGIRKPTQDLFVHPKFDTVKPNVVGTAATGTGGDCSTFNCVSVVSARFHTT